MAQISLNAKTRSITTHGALLKLRTNKEIPAVMYAAGRPSQALSFKLEDFELMAKEQPLHHPVELVIDEKEKKKVIIKEVQRDVVKGQIIHIDFLEVIEGRKIRVKVPVRLNGESFGVKNQGGVLQYVMRKIEIEADPAKVPVRIEFDVTELKRGQAIFVRDLPVDGFKVITPAGQVVGTITGARGLEEEAAEAAAAAVAAGEVPAAADAAAAVGPDGKPLPAGDKDKKAPGAKAEGEKKDAAPGAKPAAGGKAAPAAPAAKAPAGKGDKKK